MEPTEKQKIEKATAELFLELYNELRGTNFRLEAMGDHPDATCIDQTTGKRLDLEISLLEDAPGDIQEALGRGPVRPSPNLDKDIPAGVRGFTEDATPGLRTSLGKKLLSKYGPSTALVLRQTSPIWGPAQWAQVAEGLKATLLQGREDNYGAGVWIITIDGSTLPARDTLFRLSEGQ